MSVATKRSLAVDLAEAEASFRNEFLTWRSERAAWKQLVAGIREGGNLDGLAVEAAAAGASRAEARELIELRNRGLHFQTQAAELPSLQRQADGLDRQIKNAESEMKTAGPARFAELDAALAELRGRRTLLTRGDLGQAELASKAVNAAVAAGVI